MNDKHKDRNGIATQKGGHVVTPYFLPTLPPTPPCQMSLCQHLVGLILVLRSPFAVRARTCMWLFRCWMSVLQDMPGSRDLCCLPPIHPFLVACELLLLGCGGHTMLLCGIDAAAALSASPCPPLQLMLSSSTAHFPN